VSGTGGGKDKRFTAGGEERGPPVPSLFPREEEGAYLRPLEARTGNPKERTLGELIHAGGNGAGGKREREGFMRKLMREGEEKEKKWRAFMIVLPRRPCRREKRNFKEGGRDGIAFLELEKRRKKGPSYTLPVLFRIKGRNEAVCRA